MVAATLGCEAYRPLPITDAAVEQALRPPTTDQLRTRLSTVANPLLRRSDVNADAALTPDTASVIAVATNLTLQATRDQVRAAQAKLKQAGILPNPSLSFSVDFPVGTNTTGSVPGYGLTLDWEITSLVTLDANKKSAQAAVEQSRLDVAWQEWQIAEAARQATYDVLILRKQVEIAEALAERLDTIAGRFKALLARHDVLATDAAAADAATGEARLTAAAARRDLKDAEIGLRRAIGLPPDADVRLDSDTPLPEQSAVPDAARLTENLNAHRIDLAALRRGYDSQEQSLRAAILGQFPKIRLGLSHGRDTGDFFTVGPAFSIELPVFDRNQGNIAVERAGRQQLFDEYTGRVFEARSDIAKAVAAIGQINDQLRVADEQVKALRSLLDAQERALNAGNLDITTFYTAAVSLAQRQADQLKLVQDLVHAHISLELASGVWLPLNGPKT